MPEATLSQVMEYFGFEAQGGESRQKLFLTEWKEMTPKDKSDIREGIGNGSFTY